MKTKFKMLMFLLFIAFECNLFGATWLITNNLDFSVKATFSLDKVGDKTKSVIVNRKKTEVIDLKEKCVYSINLEKRVLFGLPGPIWARGFSLKDEDKCKNGKVIINKDELKVSYDGYTEEYYFYRR